MIQRVFTPGFYWRGIRITKPTYSVDVLPGLYIIPFATHLMHVKRDVQYMTIDADVRWFCLHRYSRFVWGWKTFSVRERMESS